MLCLCCSKCSLFWEMCGWLTVGCVSSPSLSYPCRFISSANRQKQLSLLLIQRLLICEAWKERQLISQLPFSPCFWCGIFVCGFWPWVTYGSPCRCSWEIITKSIGTVMSKGEGSGQQATMTQSSSSHRRWNGGPCVKDYAEAGGESGQPIADRLL